MDRSPVEAADAQSAKSLVVRRADVSALYRDNEALTGCGIYFHFECLVFFFSKRCTTVTRLAALLKKPSDADFIMASVASLKSSRHSDLGVRGMKLTPEQLVRQLFDLHNYAGHKTTAVYQWAGVCRRWCVFQLWLIIVFIDIIIIISACSMQNTSCSTRSVSRTIPRADLVTR